MMQRGLLLSLALALLVGTWAAAQWCCPPTAVPDVPRCYVSFNECERIEIGMKVSSGFSLFRCAPCCHPPAPQVHGWRVEDLDGSLVFQARLDRSVPATSFSAVWDQVNSVGEKAPPGYYAVIVSTDQGEFYNHLRILDRCACPPFALFRLLAGCFGSSCEPEVTLSRYSEPCRHDPCAPRVALPFCCP